MRHLACLVLPLLLSLSLDAHAEQFLDRGVGIDLERLPPEGTTTTQPVRLRLPRGDVIARVDQNAIVQVKESAPDALFASLGLTPVRALFPRAGLWLVRGRAGEDGATVAARLASAVHAGTLLQAVPDLYLPRQLYGVAVPPNDPRYSGQWYLKTIHIEDAWKLTTGSAEVTVSVVDDGCDLKHPDLQSKLETGSDFTDGDDEPLYAPNEKGNEHGTACAGLVAAATDNAEGMAGTCPECHARCVRLLPSAEAQVPVSADVAAFNFIMDRGDPVASNSWGFQAGVPVPGPLATAIRTVITEGRDGRGVLVVFAAGNSNVEIHDDELQAIEGILTVGATNNFDEAAPFSNRGESVALTAPTGTLSLDIHGPDGASDGDYTSLFGGTSSACPVVAGVAGLLFSVAPDARAEDVRDALVHSARRAPYATPDENGHDLLYGFGIVDPAAALLRLRPDLKLPEPEPTNDGSASDAGGCSCGGSRGGGWTVLAWALGAMALRVRRSRRG